MAEVLRKLPARKASRQGRPSVWARFADGRVWKVKLGVDTQCRTIGTARTAARSYATRNKLSFTYRKVSDTELAVQFT